MLFRGALFLLVQFTVSCLEAIAVGRTPNLVHDVWDEFVALVAGLHAVLANPFLFASIAIPEGADVCGGVSLDERGLEALLSLKVDEGLAEHDDLAAWEDGISLCEGHMFLVQFDLRLGAKLLGG